VPFSRMARGTRRVEGKSVPCQTRRGLPACLLLENKRDPPTKRASRSSLEWGEGCFGQRRGVSPLSPDSMERALVIGMAIYKARLPMLADSTRQRLQQTACVRRGEPKVASMTGAASSLPGGRNCSAAMTGEGPVPGVDSRIGPPTAGVPQTGVRVRSRRIVLPWLNRTFLPHWDKGCDLGTP
jgi:hypothetical protein